MFPGNQREPIIISDGEEIQIDTTEKILDAMRSRPISCFDFLSQLDRMTGVPVHNKMSVPVSSLTRWARAVKMN